MNLPVKLYRPIFQHIPDHEDLYNLLLVSHSFRNEAEPFLYQEVTLRYHGKEWNDPDTTLIQTLIGSKRLASFVKILTIIPDHYPYPIMSGEPDDHWRPAHQVLCAVKNLKILMVQMDLKFVIGCKFYPSFSLLAGSSFQLERLDMFGFRDDVDRQFLEAQQNVTELGTIEPNRVNISKTALPNLAILSAYSPCIPNILGGRRVRALKLYSFSTAEWSPSSCFKSVKALYLCTKTVTDFPQIPTRFPSLRYLRLRFTVYDELQPIPLADILAACGQSPTIYKLHLSTPSPPHYIHAIFSSVSSLQTISTGYRLSPVVEWSRDAAEPRHFPHGAFKNEWKDARWSQPLP